MSLLPALRTPGVPALLVVCFGYMTAFYGMYAYLGDHLRQALGVSSATAGLVVLAYGVGFGLAGFGDRMVDRLGPHAPAPDNAGRAGAGLWIDDPGGIQPRGACRPGVLLGVGEPLRP